MPTLSDTQLRSLARLGAIARLKEIEEEAAGIRRAFPGLRTRGAQPESAKPDTAAKPKKRKRNLSPEAREEAAERMRAYWAKKRESAAGAAAASSPASQPKEAAPRKHTTPKQRKASKNTPR